LTVINGLDNAPLVAGKVRSPIKVDADSVDGTGALSDLKQVNAMLCEAVGCVPKAVSFSEALACALALVCRRTGWSWGEAWSPTGPGGPLVQVVDPYVASAKLAGFAEAGRRLKFAPGEGLPGHCWRARCPIVFEDVAQEPLERFPRRDLARLYGVHTGLAVPVGTADEPLAVLVFFADSIRPVSTAVVEGIAGVARLLASVPARIRVGADVSLSHRRQALLSEVTALGLRERSLEEVLPEALHLILQLPGLALRPMGCVFLADDAGTHLRMVAHENMPAAATQACAQVPYGSCLCGSAATSGTTVITTKVDARHSTVYEGMVPHGHYCAPLRAAGRMVGVLCLYTDPGHRRDPEEEMVVDTAARALAGLILRSRLTRDLAISRDNFTTMIHQAPMGAIIVGPDGCIRFANTVVEWMFGLGPGQAVGLRLGDYLEWRADEAVLRGEGREPLLLHVVRSAIIWGEETAEMVILTDITARRTMEKVSHTVVGAHYPDIARRVIERGVSRYLPEERPISVLFVDMKDSTHMAATQGSAHLAERLEALYRMVIEAVDATGGSINNFIGDAVMGTFNAPLALSDHAWRAVEAGGRFLTLLASFRRDRPDASFDVHIGIETGEALVGDLGPEQRYLYTVAGPCVHFASRLTKLPLENRVVVGAGTAQALAGRVTFTPWGPVAIGGLAGSHHAYLVGEDLGPALELPGGPGR